MRMKSGIAATIFIWLAGHNLAVSWKTGSRPNVGSRVSDAERIDTMPGVAS